MRPQAEGGRSNPHITGELPPLGAVVPAIVIAKDEPAVSCVEHREAVVEAVERRLFGGGRFHQRLSY